MTNPGMPEWALEIPSAPVHQEQSNQLVRPFTAQQLLQIGGELIEQFIKRVVLALAGFFIPGDLGAAFEQLKAWGDRVGAMFSNLAALFGIEDTDLDGDIDVHDVWQTVVNTFIQPLLDLFDAIGDGINAILGPIFGGIDLKDPPTPGEVWQTVINTLMLPLNLLLGPNSPLNALNIFGRLQLPQFGGGVPLSALTPTVPNELEPFSATSVPTSDGWSWDAAAGAAKVVADGSTKTLFLSGAAIKVDADQPLQYQIPVRYTGVTSGAGQTIQLALDTFTSDDGLGTATRVVVGAITSPSGTLSVPTVLGALNWDVPDGVGSVRPVLVVDELVTAGSVFWLNTPVLKKKLAGPLSDGLPKAIQDRIDDFEGLLSDLLSNPAGVIGTITQDMVSGLPDLNTLTNQIRDILAGLVVTPINATVQAIKDWFTGLGGKTQNLTSGGNLPQSAVDGLNDLATQTNQIIDILAGGIVTPINTAVAAVKDWFGQWFGGGSEVAIPLSQKGAAYGVAPLGADQKVPLVNLPDLGGGGGTGTVHDHFTLTLAADVSVPSSTETVLSGWQQVGSQAVTFEDSSNDEFRFPSIDGWWDVESCIVWASSTTGNRQSALTRTLTDTSNLLVQSDGTAASAHGLWAPRNNMDTVVDVTNTGALRANDPFQVKAWQNSGAPLNVLADGTYLRAVYLGARQPDLDTVEQIPVVYDNRGGGVSASGIGSRTSPYSQSWSHVCTGSNLKLIVIARIIGSVNASTIGAIKFVVNGSQFAISSANARQVGNTTLVMASYTVPAGTATVEVVASPSSSSSVTITANSLSYANVDGVNLYRTGGTGAALSHTVVSDEYRRVVQAFAAASGDEFNADYNKNSRFAYNNSSGTVLRGGDSVGEASVTFTSTAPAAIDWMSIAIDLHAVTV